MEDGNLDGGARVGGPAACVFTASRCGRVHCYVTGVGGFLLILVPERIWGVYRAQDRDHCC